MSPFLPVLMLLPAALQAAATAPPPAQPESPAAQQTAAPSLLDVAVSFSGADSVSTIQKLLENGATVNEQDLSGDTALLHLCYPLEMDYRYNNDPHYANALRQAINLLLQNGADALMENNKGCNALFYLQSKPELLNELHNAKLIPKALAVRIPHETAAFLRYINKRTQQAKLTNHEPCRQYLVNTYCAPAYERAEQRLHDIISGSPTVRRSPGDLLALLSFMRLANSDKAHAYIHSLNYWEHSEHFLEEIPLSLLNALESIQWNVDGEDIRKALRKLDSMLPASPDEMIDCFAAGPMGLLLEILEASEGEKALPLIKQYTKCNEAELASTAYNILLNHNNQPPITTEALLSRRTTPTNMSEEEKMLYTCALVDEALRSGDISKLTPELLRQAGNGFTDMKLPRHAALLKRLTSPNGLTTDSYTIQATHHSYTELPPPSPRMKMAERLLANPTLFGQKTDNAQK